MLLVHVTQLAAAGPPDTNVNTVDAVRDGSLVLDARNGLADCALCCHAVVCHAVLPCTAVPYRR
jgi:hypothetical protein